MTENDNSLDMIAAHLRACEEALLDPAVRRDHAQVDALLANNFQEFGASGRAWTREEIFALLATDTCEPTAIEAFHCALIGEGVALVTYRAVRADVDTGLHSASLRSSIWLRQAAMWRLRFHQGTRTE